MEIYCCCSTFYCQFAGVSFVRLLAGAEFVYARNLGVVCSGEC